MIKEAFLKNLYKSILNREADPEGFKINLDRLGGDPSFYDAASLVEAFISSDEYRRFNEIKSMADSIDIISAGDHCLTSYELKKAGLKRFSGPFAWCFSSPEMIEHCISDDFHIFLKRGYHHFIPEEFLKDSESNFCDHLYYREKFGVKYVFNHCYITKKDSYDYYCRCVDRFISSMNSARPSLLICAGYDISAYSFEKLSEAISRRTNSYLLAINRATIFPNIIDG